MAYGKCKVYSDGSHYIAIPHTTRNVRKRPKPPEEMIEVEVEEKERVEIIQEQKIQEVPENAQESTILGEKEVVKQTKKTRSMTRKQLFEELYKGTVDMRKRQRKEYILKRMLPYFNSKEQAKEYVELQFERKHRNTVCRRVRLNRKVNLQEFNYFCTFTYDDAKHTEETFKRKLQGCFKMMCYRKGWKYAGVWERSPEKKRLHFHGLFYVPESGKVGEIIEVKDYSVVQKKVQITHQNTYFLERFGRNDFKDIVGKRALSEAIGYMTKYMEKTGEKIVCSKNLPQYFISDILDEDIVCPYGMEDKKLLLFDNFKCFDEGEYMGEVSPETIAKMPKGN